MLRLLNFLKERATILNKQTLCTMLIYAPTNTRAQIEFWHYARSMLSFLIL